VKLVHGERADDAASTTGGIATHIIFAGSAAGHASLSKGGYG
jgi:hypothetical protein